jgi:hypothetical protein
MAVWKVGLQGDRLSPGLDAVFECGAALGLGRVLAQPIIRTPQVSRGIEGIGTAARELCPPDICGSPRTREVGAVGIEMTCFSRACGTRGIRGLRRQDRDIE